MDLRMTAAAALAAFVLPVAAQAASGIPEGTFTIFCEGTGTHKEADTKGFGVFRGSPSKTKERTSKAYFFTFHHPQAVVYRFSSVDDEAPRSFIYKSTSAEYSVKAKIADSDPSETHEMRFDRYAMTWWYKQAIDWRDAPSDEPVREVTEVEGKCHRAETIVPPQLNGGPRI